MATYTFILLKNIKENSMQDIKIEEIANEIGMQSKELIIRVQLLYDGIKSPKSTVKPEEAKDILWRNMNNPKYFEQKRQLDNGGFNIFGHYPILEPIVAKTYALIDTGATYKNNRDLGRLSAIHYPSMKILEYGIKDE